VSAFIDGTGAVHDATPIFEPAWRVRDVPLHPAPSEATFYVRHGDVFAFACWAVWLAHFAVGISRRRAGR
jgi:apolipoprotein N-acyltransferase